MPLSRSVRLGLLLTGLFAAGAAAGGLVTLGAVKRAGRRALQPDRWEPTISERIIGPLELTPEQDARIRPHIKAAVEETRTAYRQAVGRAVEVFSRLDTQIAAELTPEQRTRFEQMKEERRERLRRYTGRAFPGFQGGPPPNRPFRQDRPGPDRPPQDRPHGDRPPPDAPGT